MKKIAQALVLALFTVQSTLALPAHHRVQSQAIALSSGMESSLDLAEAQLTTPADAHWVQKFAKRLETKGRKKYLRQLERELGQSGLSDAEKDRMRAEAETRITSAIPQLVEKARVARTPVGLIRQLKQELREARAQSQAPTAAASKANTDRQPAQLGFHGGNPILTLALLILAIGLALLALSFLVAFTIAFVQIMAPIIVIGIVVYIVI